MLGAIGFVLQWYVSLVYIAAIVGALVSFWIYYDADRKGLLRPPAFVIAICGTLAVIPSLLIALFPSIAPNISLEMLTALCYVGVAGAVAVVFGAIMYASGGGQQAIPMSQYPMAPTVRTEPVQAPPPVEPLPTGGPRVAPVDRTRLMHEQAPAAGWLVAKSGSRAGHSVPLSRGSTTIGRSSRCNQIVEDPSVSGEHCRIIFENGQFVIYDLASLNGTFVNGRKVQRQMLMDGDRIRLANSEFVFKKA